MKAMILEKIVSLETSATPLALVDLPVPDALAGEVRIKVSACGVCHTELDEIEGRAAPPRLPVVPGHEVVGRIDALGPGVRGREIGERVGVGWIHSSSGGPDENLDPAFRATGRDVNGGYAQYMTVPAAYAHPIPETFADAEAAPLLCAGAVGYRALRLARIEDGQRLGFTGFGGSAHLVLQLARHLFPRSRFSVFARDEGARRFRVAFERRGDAEDAHLDGEFLEDAQHPPDADARAVFERRFDQRIALARHRRKADIVEHALRSLVAVEDIGLAAAFIVEVEIDGDARPARPLGVRRVGAMADIIARPILIRRFTHRRLPLF